LIYRYRTKTDANGQPILLGPAITDSESALSGIARLLLDEAVEVFGILSLTTRRQIIGWHEVCHSHPSGDPDPSHDDLMLTRRLIHVGGILGIDVLDHIIVGDSCSVSLRKTTRIAFHDRPQSVVRQDKGRGRRGCHDRNHEYVLPNATVSGFLLCVSPFNDELKD
jgi:hypothetical protein